jgi:hypothetical protein
MVKLQEKIVENRLGEDSTVVVFSQDSQVLSLFCKKITN